MKKSVIVYVYLCACVIIFDECVKISELIFRTRRNIGSSMLSLSLSLSLSLFLTHTHTHTQTFTHIQGVSIYLSITSFSIHTFLNHRQLSDPTLQKANFRYLSRTRNFLSLFLFSFSLYMIFFFFGPISFFLLLLVLYFFFSFPFFCNSFFFHFLHSFLRKSFHTFACHSLLSFLKISSFFVGFSFIFFLFLIFYSFVSFFHGISTSVCYVTPKPFSSNNTRITM